VPNLICAAISNSSAFFRKPDTDYTDCTDAHGKLAEFSECLSRFALAPAAETNDCKRMADEKLIMSTAGSKDEAVRIGRMLVEERLAACVNVLGPIASVYRWQGKIEDAQEVLMLIKTTAKKSAGTISRLRELHSYELPEAIELDIKAGSPEYLKWLRENC
jgi:periplasmic divalent cation tolerance protein